MSTTYGRDATPSRDPVLASVVGDRTWDTYLSGACTPLAMQGANHDWTLSAWEVHESVWRAGYPYTLQDVQAFAAERDAPPPEELLVWLEGVPRGVDLGLVRAHGTRRDAWVAITAKPRVDLGIFPRSLALGEKITLPEVPDGTYRIADADGVMREGPLDRGLDLAADVQGEWLVQVLDPEGVVATFPLYVDAAPPRENLMPALPAQVASAAEATDHLVDLIEKVRDAYDTRPWEWDPRLDALAAELLGRPAKDAAALALDSGVVTQPVQVWTCTAPYVESCIDALVWNPRQRHALLSDEFRVFGAATAVEADKVRIRVVITGE